jgi:hypothetical protein
MIYRTRDKHPNHYTTDAVLNGVQHYVKKFVRDLRQVGGFLRELRFSPPIKQTNTI